MAEGWGRLHRRPYCGAPDGVLMKAMSSWAASHEGRRWAPEWPGSWGEAWMRMACLLLGWTPGGSCRALGAWPGLGLGLGLRSWTEGPSPRALATVLAPFPVILSHLSVSVLLLPRCCTLSPLLSIPAPLTAPHPRNSLCCCLCVLGPWEQKHNVRSALDMAAGAWAVLHVDARLISTAR